MTFLSLYMGDRVDYKIIQKTMSKKEKKEKKDWKDKIINRQMSGKKIKKK